MKNFEACLQVILDAEGGYVDHPRDPGGKTNLGITLRTYSEWTGKPMNSITEADMRSLTVEDVAPIYKEKYWKRIDGDRLPPGIDLSIFDMAVNAGPHRAVKLMQAILPNCYVDGVIGPITIRKVEEEYSDDPAGLIKDYAHQREVYYRSLSHFDAFGRGWLNRVRKTEDISLSMID